MRTARQGSANVNTMSSSGRTDTAYCSCVEAASEGWSKAASLVAADQHSSSRHHSRTKIRPSTRWLAEMLVVVVVLVASVDDDVSAE